MTPEIKEEFIKSQPSFSVVDIDKPIANNPKSNMTPWANWVVPISTRLANIDPTLKTAIRDFEYEWMNSSNVDRKSSSIFS